jgi:hypothetical protein
MQNINYNSKIHTHTHTQTHRSRWNIWMQLKYYIIHAMHHAVYGIWNINHALHVQLYISAAFNDWKHSLLKLTPRIPGTFNTVPRTGTRLRKFIATGKNPLKEKISAYHLNYPAMMDEQTVSDTVKIHSMLLSWLSIQRSLLSDLLEL